VSRKKVKGFEDFWIRAGLPPDERLHVEIAFNDAIERTCERLAQVLKVPVEQLRDATKDLKA
jgi:hypothetical protein